MKTQFKNLEYLESESLQIIWEAVSSFKNPAMLYSMGKDSSVMLHLMRKAFHPGKIPFPLVHVDTLWKFKEMTAFRDRMAKKIGFDLIVYVNPQGAKDGINPFVYGSEIHTDIMKTQALKKMIKKYEFDAVFGGARRDEEKSRAKERIFSFRDKNNHWDPKNQRPELWQIYNTKIKDDESVRIFPLSNWTEKDIWLYIYQENIEIVPLYFSAKRPVVEKYGTLIMVDNDRFPLQKGERIKYERVRFRTLGCYPLTGAIRSKAATVPEIIEETMGSKYSERQGRVIDFDQRSSMEKKKREGYF